MRARFFYVVVAALLCGGYLPNFASGAGQVPWAPDLPTAQRVASQRGQPVLVHFWSPDCTPCQRLDYSVFNDQTFIDVLSREFVPVKVNVQEYPAVAQQYGINQWPMDLVLGPDGRPVSQPVVSPQDTRQYIAMLTQIAARQRVYGTDRYSQPAPAEAGLAGYNASENSAGQPSGYAYDFRSPEGGYRGFDRGRAASDSRMNRAQSMSSETFYPAGSDTSYDPLPPRQQTEPREPPTAEIHNKYASHLAESPQVDPRRTGTSDGRVAPGNGQSTGYAPAAGSGPSPTDYASRQLQPASSYQAGGGEWPPRGAGPQPNSGAPNPMAAGGPGDAVSSASGGATPPFGLEGYCPVALVEQSKWVKGDPRWGVIHRGRTYLFSSVDAKQRFWSSPDRYTPRYPVSILSCSRNPARVSREDAAMASSTRTTSTCSPASNRCSGSGVRRTHSPSRFGRRLGPRARPADGDSRGRDLAVHAAGLLLVPSQCRRLTRIG